MTLIVSICHDRRVLLIRRYSNGGRILLQRSTLIWLLVIHVGIILLQLPTVSILLSCINFCTALCGWSICALSSRVRERCRNLSSIAFVIIEVLLEIVVVVAAIEA